MEPVIGSARLFAAFENAGLSPGAELRSPAGPGGQPAASVVRAFEEAMTPPGGVPGAEAVSGGVMPQPTAESTLTPVDLYRTQFRIGMLGAHLRGALNVSQSVSQSLETALKQSG